MKNQPLHLYTKLFFVFLITFMDMQLFSIQMSITHFKNSKHIWKANTNLANLKLRIRTRKHFSPLILYVGESNQGQMMRKQLLSILTVWPPQASDI